MCVEVFVYWVKYKITTNKHSFNAYHGPGTEPAAFKHIDSFNLQDHPMRWDYFLPQFYSWVTKAWGI